MPKEIISAHEPRLFDEEGREVPQETQNFVQVGWSSEAEYVQVATGTRDAVTHESSSDDWWFVQLGRREINDLIKVLRRARDQAFGRDE